MFRARQGAATPLFASAVFAAIASAALTGCGTPGSPLPPSLNLPDPVTDLSAIRAGNQVQLTWTMPRRNTDKILLKSNVDVRVCRKESSNPCVLAGDVKVAPAAAGSFSDTLPAPQVVGLPRPLSYFIELRNQNGRSAGLSNAAVVLAGQAPAPVTGFAAEPRKDGIVLRWNATDPQDSIRLHRTLLNPPAAKPRSEQRPLAPPPETTRQNLLVEHDPGTALDKDIRFGQTYEYRAQRIARIEIDGKPIELAGEISAPVRIDAQDIFPPTAPAGLAAVAIGATDQSPASIDLSWQPSADPDIAGYFVYRREEQGSWQRISGDQPIIAPAFHDAQVSAGHTYSYAVSAVDARANESPHSAEASDTVPTP